MTAPLMEDVLETVAATVPPASTDAPDHVRSCVTIGPVEPWVKRAEVDESFDAPAASQVILLLDRQHHTASKAMHYRVVQRLKTLRGVHEVSQWRLNFDPTTDRIVIHSVTIRRGGESVEHASVSKLRFLQRETNIERLVIDGFWTLLLIVEDVQVGDILDASYTLTRINRFLPDRQSAFLEIPFGVPIRDLHFTVRFPHSEPMKWTGGDAEFAPEIVASEGEVEWNWKVEYVQPVEAEPNTPLWYMKKRWVQFSDYRSWQEIAVAVADVWPTGRKCPEVAALAQQTSAKRTARLPPRPAR